MIVELHAGEMLYLPASWFHEVKILCLHITEESVYRLAIAFSWNQLYFSY